jgi:ribonuclease P protein component
VKVCKLKTRADFVSLREGGLYIKSGAVCLQFGIVSHEQLPDDGRGVVFFGITASRKVGGAVIRNRAKRRLRVQARNNILAYLAGSGFSVSPKLHKKVSLSKKTLMQCYCHQHDSEQSDTCTSADKLVSDLKTHENLNTEKAEMAEMAANAEMAERADQRGVLDKSSEGSVLLDKNELKHCSCDNTRLGCGIAIVLIATKQTTIRRWDALSSDVISAVKIAISKYSDVCQTRHARSK